MRICCAISRFSSMFSLTMRTAPLAALTVFSRIGPNCLHGPHHGAQKSTTTGRSNEASTTSAIKFAVVTSLTSAAPAAPLPATPNIGSLAIRRSPAVFATTWPHRAVKTSITARFAANEDALHGRCGRGGVGFALERFEVEDRRPVAARGHKPQEVAGRDR